MTQGRSHHALLLTGAQRKAESLADAWSCSPSFSPDARGLMQQKLTPPTGHCGESQLSLFLYLGNWCPLQGPGLALPATPPASSTHYLSQWVPWP